ncbi:MAG: hypothetical protein A2177_07630 [Spirochaetes bacterium RBG_13_68_11]|nr:MAG: hypothetical protein A2177_07630 [Spirochaetes bacterium RBG_13_68_11]
MIDLDGLREYMRRQSEEDRKNRTVQVEASSIDEGLRQASIELGVPVVLLSYEVLVHGTPGTLGMGRRSWRLSVYVPGRTALAPHEEGAEAPVAAAETGPLDVPGEVFVRIAGDGAFLRAVKPRGRGARATEVMALERLSLRGVSGFDPSLVSRVVRHADGEWVRVADVRYTPANDSVVSVEVSDGEMKASIVASEPGAGGADPTADYLRGVLQSRGVVHGIKDDVLAEFESAPRYNRPIVAAEGTRSHDGADARIAFQFKHDREAIALKEKDGRVDFKDISRIENVVAGQLLARKVPAEPGEAGMTITGTVIPAKPGRDAEIQIGKNVRLSEDGITATSEINGQVLVLAGRITVEPIYTISGDVNLHTGNVLFLGTVVVRGSVEDDFSVKAAGNIEVFGSVGKCTLDAEGDIIVHQGIAAKDEGSVRCGGSVYSKFIQHARIQAGENVVVTDGIIHSQVDANRTILCQGRRAQIVGGRLRASEEINSKILGSVAGTETVLEVGYDPKSKERLAQLETERHAVEKSLEEVERNIRTLENLQKVQHKLSDEKAQYLAEQSEQRRELLGRLEAATRETGEINTYLMSLTSIGKISASERVFPGVRLAIKNANLAVRTEFKFVTFFLQGGEVRVTKYESFNEELMRRR